MNTDVKLEEETVWLTINQMAELFQRDKSVISRHIKNIFKRGNWRKNQLLHISQQFKMKEGGCSGNLQGIGSLVRGMPIREVIKRCAKIHCGEKLTSCPDQLARILKNYFENK